MAGTSLQQVNGLLRLQFAYDRARACTTLVSSVQEPPLRIVHAFAQKDGGTLLHLHNLSGGVLGGDRLRLDVEVGPAARVQLTTTGATRLYRNRSQTEPALQENRVTVRVDGLLEYLPDQLIPFAGSAYRQSTHIELEEGAGLFWWETVAPGRLARGECFAYDLLQLEMQINARGRPVASERFRLEPAKRSLTSLARLGQFCYQSSFLICRVGLPATRWRELEEQMSELAESLSRPGEIHWAATRLVAHGLLVRAVSRSSHPIASGLLSCWQLARLALYGQSASLPRKLY